LTNHHVFENARQIALGVNQGRQLLSRGAIFRHNEAITEPPRGRADEIGTRVPCHGRGRLSRYSGLPPPLGRIEHDSNKEDFNP
jgi:hypothetical protein